jgi:cytosine/adenosine deaminase-related metal-dependent hydrolase
MKENVMSNGTATSKLLRARIVLPISRPPIKDGAVLVSGDRIVAVGRWKEIAEHATRNTEHVDLGDSILLPGLINAHCHLDYTDMAGTIPPQKSFTDWIKLITAAKSEWSYSEFAESWLRGAKMLLRTGTTTVADFENVPELLPDVWTATPLRVISFLELTGVRSRRDPRLILNEAVARIDSLSHERSKISLAPHAPYSTIPDLLKLCAETARKRGWNLSIHVAESAQEFDMFMRRRGEMFKWLKRSQRDMSDCGKRSPVQHLRECGALGKNVLAVHANYLGRRDIELLKKNNASVAHCPRSHLYFQHRKFPFAALAKARINICLGSDSLATVIKTRRQSVELNMFEEMRAFTKAHPRVPAKTILQMATINGARALGLAKQTGEISKARFADFIAIPAKTKLTEAYEAVLHHLGDVTSSMIAGRWVLKPK